MAKKNLRELAFAALNIEGALLAPDFLNKVAHLDAKSDQNETDYDIPRGLKLREFGEYRTRRLVLAAWDSLHDGSRL